MTKELSLIPTPQEMQALEIICKYAVESKYFQSLGGIAGVMCIALYAREIGVPVMTAVNGGFSNVQGKITMSAELMHSLLRGNGVRIKIIQSDSTRCEIYGKRSDTGDEYTSLYTIEDAKKANLVKSGGSWEKNPSDMLFARCISRLRRRLAPDIATKAYVEGELEDAEVDMTAAPSPSQPSEEEITAQFKEKFKSIENMDYDLEEFVKFTSEKGKKSTIETIKSALNQVEKFTAAYLKWVASKEPVQEVSAVVETKEMTLV